MIFFKYFIQSLFILFVINDASSQKIDTLYLFSKGVDSNYEIFKDLVRISDYSNNEVICMRTAYKIVPFVYRRIIKNDRITLVCTNNGDLFHFQIRKFFTISRMVQKKRSLKIFFEIEDLTEKKIFKKGYFEYKILDNEWVYNHLKIFD